MAALKQVGLLSRSFLNKNLPFIHIARNYKKITEKDSTELIKQARIPAQLKNLPGPYPKTEEERRKAAEKYNLHPDDYKPYPNDYRHAGDYPDLPWIGYDARDPFYPWDFPVQRRNYGEPIHQFMDQMEGTRYAYGVRQVVSDRTGAYTFWFIFLTLIGISYMSMDTTQPLMEKQFPGKGEHYTFNIVK